MCWSLAGSKAAVVVGWGREESLGWMKCRKKRKGRQPHNEAEQYLIYCALRLVNMIIVSNYFNVAKVGKRKFPSVLLYCKCMNCSCVIHIY